MRDSTGSSLSLRSNNSGNNSSHDDLPSKSHSGRSSPATEYVCPVCHKCYANNSTLRRHLKIHAYACSAASAAVAAATTTTTGMMTLGVAQEQYSHAQRRHRSILVSEGDDDELEAEGDDGGQGMFSAAAAATAIKEEESDSWVALSASSRLAAASSSAKSSPRLKLTPPSSSHHLHHHHPSSSSPTFLASSAFSSSPSSSPSSFGLSMPALVTTSALLSSSILQYRPGVDTDYRKPECVGCNKAFARRDTVILHIKNIRRKWEIHWHAQKMALSATVTTDDNRRAQCNEEDMKEEAVEEDEEERVVDGDEEQEEEEEEEEEEEVNDSGTDAHRPQRSGRPKSRRDPREAARLYYADGNDSVSTAHYTSHSSHRRVTTTKKDALAPPSGRHGPKFSKEEEDELLQALAEVSPCYRERRVRMFGSFGMVEEPVLQD
ncbi:hypothetical protein DFQ27_007846 [Actinomortierella ambigua]|uniref:C2H2-type domain-containing protein n=1 Tax=Actinomortierella ambigua TaxID=1343610 RepID=A0A9P6UBJ0_9FUNG|nr:hypothetical protein DFQ27_007846 [Actinomortierella ambigua]